MRETIDIPRNNSTNNFRNLAISLAICTALSSCGSRESKLDSQEQKVAQLEYRLQKQAENYHKVYVQENVQQDLKAQGADGTINQEISYSLDYAAKQDKKIARTKKRLNRSQKKLTRMQERGGDVSSTQSYPDGLNTRLTDKYNYIPEEFKRTQQRK